MGRKLLGSALLALVLAAPAAAEVTGIVTVANSQIILTPDEGTFVFDYTGENLSDAVGDRFGSNAAFSSTSDVAGDSIVFQNGNAAAGIASQVSSFTSLDITFRNSGTTAVQPILHSSITPAGLGLFVSAFCGEEARLPNCGGSNDYGPLSVQQRSLNGGEGSIIASSSFFFNVLSDGNAIYSISGGISLVYDFSLQQAIVVTDLADASARLTNFNLVTDPEDPYAIGFAWDATDIDIAIEGLLNPGELRTLTYETGVTSFTRNQSFDGRNVVAYAGFGDPIGRNGSIPPPPSFTAFGFDTPTFGDDGSLDVTYTGSLVPEPATWAMMIGGFGLVGAAARRRRTLVAA
ncbi:PEPxxWA-CTERM sorting domain-containing protein [Glacieibacterium frigidum]|uniref:PEP-CTERM sorting domain-containing protein n=1 Tax=Glacieibacterium frigidum TaxID=2593303 RepID=A0A552UAK2_9SPHN|nr:PEPxxWA-CTERM sorting domain-containing protein [Glacieibacterium frigidum]TRW15244.1 PEP-CTERM sorting domain-containing protein [Glacieibacterium frigidum]